MNKTEKTTMSVREMGQILGLSKTESYWLVHKQCFETTLVQGVMRVILSILVDTFISKISLPMQPVPEIGSISVA